MADIVERLKWGFRSRANSVEAANLMADAGYEIVRLRLDVERLNQMLRDTGYGQGQVDAYVDQCEEIDRLRERVAALESSEKYLVEKIARMRKKERLEIHAAVEQLREKRN